jgi:3-oxoacyl-[acyl-carrier protein] reductase
MSYSLENKVVVVTGATKGMGLASSKSLLELGANVVMVYCRDTANAKQVEAKLASYAGQMLLLQADITKVEDRQRILALTLEKFKQIDVLVNNAGIAAKSGFLKEQEEAYDLVLDVNLKAPIFLAKLVAQQMIEQGYGGSIINFSSVSGHRGAGGISYDAAKAGLICATQTMANTLGKHGIRVNSISPGLHKTEMNRHHWEQSTELFNSLVGATPLGRAAQADEIAGTVVYLASDQSSYTTGIDILVDGGYLAVLPGR